MRLHPLTPERAFDFALLALGAVTIGLVLGDVTTPVRAPAVMAFYVVGPGWAAMALARAKLSVLNIVLAVGLSAASGIVTSVLLVAWTNWSWRPAGLLWAAATVAALARALAAPREVVGPILTWASVRRRARLRPGFDREHYWWPAVLGTLLAVTAIAAADAAEVSGLGLIGATPWWYFVGMALLVGGFVRAIHGRTLREPVAWAHLVAFTVLLHGLSTFIQARPRFAVAWLHAGFVNQIADQGEVLPRLDARFSWPGFFSFFAYLGRLGDTGYWQNALRVFPIFVNLVAAVLIAELGRTLRLGRRAALLAAFVFVVTNWIGQDYFAPQAVSFLFCLGVLLVALKQFGTVSPEPWWIGRLLGSGNAEPPLEPEAPIGRPGLVFGALLLIGTALVLTHQLSPAFLAAFLAGLAVTRRTRVRWLGVVLGLGFVLWLSHGAEIYWAGHFDTVAGAGGDIGSVFRANVANRTQSAAADRKVVILSRVGYLLGVWLLTSALILTRRVRKKLDPALLVLFVGPFFVIPFQSYGGEILLRVALFTLPACAVALASLLPERPKRVATSVVLGAALSLAVPAFVIARYGNERFEGVSTNDARLVSAMYETVPDGSVVFVRNRNTLVYSQRVDAVRFVTIEKDETKGRNQIVGSGRVRPTYVLVTDSMREWGKLVDGFGSTWLDDYADELISDGVAHQVLRIGGSRLLQVEGEE